jgi:hypothetical protein
MFTLVHITVEFTPADVDVSLKDFPPASSETVLPILPLTPSPVFVLSFLFTIFARGLLFICSRIKKGEGPRDGFFFKKTNKQSNLYRFTVHHSL